MSTRSIPMDTGLDQERLPSTRRAVLLMLVPTALLTALIVGYVVSHGGAVEEAALRRVLPALIAVGHSIALGVLVLVLRSEGRSLLDAGWRLPEGARLGRELAIGLVAALALYLFKELALDSIRALLAGRTPTFTTLFRFGAPVGEGALLAVASTFVVVEEAIYRGYGLPPLASRWGVVPGLLVMGVLFGLLHWGNGLLAILFTGAFGVAFGALFLWRRSLIPVAVAHIGYNVLVILS